MDPRKGWPKPSDHGRAHGHERSTNSPAQGRRLVSQNVNCGTSTHTHTAVVIHGRAVENSAALANPEALEYFRDLAELRS